jgi:hypothetical protein
MIQAVAGEAHNEMVPLTFPDGQVLRVPLQAIEGTPSAGAKVSVLFALPGGEDAARQSLAKNLVNELIGGNV